MADAAVVQRGRWPDQTSDSCGCVCMMPPAPCRLRVGGTLLGARVEGVGLVRGVLWLVLGRVAQQQQQRRPLR